MEESFIHSEANGWTNIVAREEKFRGGRTIADLQSIWRALFRRFALSPQLIQDFYTSISTTYTGPKPTMYMKGETSVTYYPPELQILMLNHFAELYKKENLGWNRIEVDREIDHIKEKWKL